MMRKSDHQYILDRRTEYTDEWKPIEYYTYFHTVLEILRDLFHYLSFRDYDCVVEKGFLLMGYRDRRLRYEKKNPFLSICVGVLNSFDSGEYLYGAGQESIEFLNNDGRVVDTAFWFSSAYYTNEGLQHVDGGHKPETTNFKIVKFYIDGYDDLEFSIEFYRYVINSDEDVKQTYNRNKSVTFPKSIFLNRGSVFFNGMGFPTIQHPEEWLEIYYGKDWNVPLDKDAYLQKTYGNNWKRR